MCLISMPNVCQCHGLFITVHKTTKYIIGLGSVGRFNSCGGLSGNAIDFYLLTKQLVYVVDEIDY